MEYAALAGVDSVAVTVVDDDYPIVSVPELEVAEGATGTYTVTLALAPSSDVVIGVATSADSDGDVTVSPASLTFSTSSWNTAQTVTVTAGDRRRHRRRLRHGDPHRGQREQRRHLRRRAHRLRGGDGGRQRRLEGDRFGDSELSVNEAATGTYTVKLGEAPTSDVVIDVARLGGSTDVSVSPSTLTFTSSSWSTARTVTVTAIDDDRCRR